MHAQLAKVQAQLQENTARLLSLMERLPDAAWRRQPPSGGWSVGQCVMHINASTEGFLPRLDAAIQEASARNLSGVGPFRRDFLGWLLCRIVEPPYRIRIKTPAKFDPELVDPSDKVRTDWERLQSELYRRIAVADGLALNKVKVVSPFVENTKYNLLAAFMVIPAHQRRHLWQAEQVVKSFHDVRGLQSESCPPDSGGQFDLKEIIGRRIDV